MELLSDSEYTRLQGLRKEICAAQLTKDTLSPVMLKWLDDMTFMMVCLTEARDWIWAWTH